MKIVFSVLLFVVSQFSFAADAISTGFLSNKAVSGYDTVAYFTENRPVKGSNKYKAEYQGADWYFSSQEHLNLFKAEPEKYAPQFGGYCAWAISAQNDFASSDPEQWAIVEGKLYLNYNQSVKEKWDADRALHIQQADKNWPNLIK
ncbi:YHS domain-containing (seleno)protein [Marinomonas sp. 5E14-1]|uniref:YHS domain-containing (seleno)protein n=1 Tax=Marinomonas sp. 5E14-1 TaxID=3153922 RepID=UPI003264B532